MSKVAYSVKDVLMDHTVAMEDVNGRTGEPGIFQPAMSITYFLTVIRLRMLLPEQ
jgi:hypothetical protein